MKAARAILLMAMGTLLAGCSPFSQPHGAWLDGPPRPATLPGYEAYALKDGRIVLVSFGVFQGPPPPSYFTVATYDPAGKVWRAAAPYPADWTPSSGILLRDGSLFFPGGVGMQTLRYLPGEDHWVRFAPMATQRNSTRAIQLKDGRVLVVGGQGPGGQSEPLDSAELWDPRTGAWSPAGHLQQPRSGHALVLLKDGRVLVIGGTDATGFGLVNSELYNPQTNAWSKGAAQQIPSQLPRAALLPDGRVLSVNQFDTFGGSLAFSEIYDPRSGFWDFGPSLPSDGGGAMATLPDGRVLLVKNGGNPQHPLFRGEIFDPRTSLWSATAVQSGETGPTLSLPDGRILVVGPSATWLYDPAAVPPASPGQSGLGSLQATVILSGVTVIMLLLVLAQYARAQVVERRRIRVV